MALLWWPLFREWLSAERRFERAADALILTGSAAAFLLSMLATFFEGPRVYFETATAVLVPSSSPRRSGAAAHIKWRASDSISFRTELGMMRPKSQYLK